MDKIQKALEKVKKEGSQGVQPKPAPHKIEPEGQKVRKKSPSLETKITYQQSKVINIDSDTLRHNRLFSYFDGNFVSDQYKIIKTKILEKTREEGLNTILITSAMPGEGKSLTAANLAISLARETSHTVLLVDTDLRKPSLHQLFDIDVQKGLSDYLIDDTSISDLLINPGISKLLFLPGKQGIENSPEVISAPKMEVFVQELKKRYPERYVIFDSPPLIESADSLILSKYVDGIILVVEAGKTQIGYVKKVLDLLEDRNLIGLVLNKGEMSEKNKYYNLIKN